MIGLWTFQKKMTAGFAVMVGLAVLTAAIAVYTLQTVVASKDRLLGINAQNLANAERLQAASNEYAAAFRGFLLLMEDRLLDQRRIAAETFDATLRRLDQGVYTPEGHRLLSDIQKAEAEFTAVQERIILLRKTKNGLQEATTVEQEAVPKRERLAGTIKAFVDREQNLLDEGKRDSTARASMASTLLVCLAVATVLFAAVTALLLGRALSRQIGVAVQHVQSSSAELQTSANQQASGAKEAATAMNEITTTVSELLATSRQIADSAQQVAHIAEETAAAARGGDQTVLRSHESIEGIRRQVDTIVSHMLNLGKKSQQIGGVLDIINELAEQTNILSINATIEAAGAGEHGKRFAVVGDEIRKLADRVSGSTKEIRQLVEEIRAAVNTTILATETGSKSVDAGLHRFEEVTRGFKEIAGMVGTTTQAAREIGLSTKQQMTAVEQVNAAIGGAAQATREAEASSAQTLQTATQLAQLSHNLSRLVQSRAAV
ncbi:MAG: CHASE3 domain-containing protein [Acidobacteriia bacterium]|nr:CHASE3 domain-containing protein [Terriglobia bacterium]